MIQVRAFGAAELRREGTEVRSVLSQPKRMALLVHLLLGSPSGFLNRDAILARFWPESDSERARNSLRQALHQLRRSLGDDVIESRGDEIGCAPGRFTCDALEFERARAEGRLEDALELYRGDFLPAFFVEDAPAAEAWIEEQRGYYRREAFRLAGALRDREAERGEVRAAIGWARRACAIEPFEEAAMRRLIGLLAAAGEAAAALAAFDEFEAKLRREHELEPAPETRTLAEGIRRDAQTTATTACLSPAPIPAEPVAAPPLPSVAPVSAVAVPPSPNRRRFPLVHVLTAVAMGMLVVVLLGLQARTRRHVPLGTPTVAVLPFVNLTGEPAQDYLATGIAEELLSVLTQVPGMKVAARTSSFSFQDRDVAVDSVARALGVTYMVEGSVRAAKSRLRINVQLIEAATGLHVWGERYERSADDLLAVQDEISRDIAKALQVQLSPAVALAPAGETRDPEAHRLLLRANQVSRSGSTREVLAETAALLEEALRRDPDYPRALAALANALSWQAVYRYTDAPSGFARARELAERSLALLPTVEAHLVLARDAELQQRDTAAADAHYRSALELAPTDPRVLQYRAIFLGRNGRVDEGIAAARRAVELDPLHPGAHNNLAVVLIEAGRQDEALDAYQAALAVSPEDAVILGNMANLMARQQRWDEALGFLERALARTPEDVQTLALRTSILLRSGRTDEGMNRLRELEAMPDFPHFRLAILYSNTGDVEKILEHLEAAVAAREDGLLALRTPTMFNGMRDHPRFVRLLADLEAQQAP